MRSSNSAKRTTSRKQHLNLPEINVHFYMLGLLKTIYWNSKILAKSAINPTSIFPASRRKSTECHLSYNRISAQFNIYP